MKFANVSKAAQLMSNSVAYTLDDLVKRQEIKQETLKLIDEADRMVYASKLQTKLNDSLKEATTVVASTKAVAQENQVLLQSLGMIEPA